METLYTRVEAAAALRVSVDTFDGRISPHLPYTLAWIWTRDRAACAHCGAALTPGRGAHLDHLTPHAHGGADEITNLVLACERCNSARQDLSLAQWAAYAAEVYGLKISPARLVKRAATPVPAALAGTGRAWRGLSVAA